MKKQVGQVGAAIGVVTLLFASRVALAEDDPKQLYDISFQASPKIKSGSAGNLTVKITPKNGGELHEETPLGLEVKGPDCISLKKAKLARADAKVTPTDTSFDAAFTGKSHCAADVEAAASFVICNPTNCFRQSVKGTAKVAVE